MKKAVILGERKAAVVEAPDPQPQADWALVKVHAAPMCTEYKGFVAGTEAASLGHEAAGEVAAVAQPGPVQVGDRVVVMPLFPCGRCWLCLAGDYIHCQSNYDFAAFTGSPEGQGTMAQYVLKPGWLLLPIPDGVSYEHASLACCALGATIGAFEMMGVDAFDTMLIAGAGPVGLGAVVNARFRAARVIVVESHPWRARRAMQLGAEAVLDPGGEDLAAQIRELTHGRGVDRALDCSGVPQAQRLCIDATRRKGKVAFVGESSEAVAIKSSPDLIRKGLALYGSWHYNISLYPRVMQVIAESPLIDRLISHVLPMTDIQEAMELSASRECAKIILKPWD